MQTTAAGRGWVAAGWLLAAGAALLGAYTVALARLPQQRAAIESLVRAQTGYDVRFGRIAVRLGFYGPEAHFTDVQMWRPGSARRLLRASDLVVRFETWRLLRSGSLRPGRILLVGAQLDADALLTARRGAGIPLPTSQTPEQRFVDRLVAFARALPQGRVELESATVRAFGRDNTGGVTGRLVRIPRLSVQRTADAARLHGNALLGERLGRTLFVAVELRGLDAGRGALEGSISVQGRALRLEGWRAALGGSSGGVTGVGDLRATLRLRGGRLQAGTLGLAASELRWPRATGAGQAHVANLSTDVGWERVAAGWRLRGTDLRIVVPGTPATPVDFDLEVDTHWSEVRCRVDRLPFGWLRPLLALPPDLDLDGTLRALRVTVLTAPHGTTLRYSARIEDGTWRDAAGQMRLAPLVFDVVGTEAGATLDFAPRPMQLHIGAAPTAAQQLDIALQGAVSVRREQGGWRLDSPALLVLDGAATAPRARLELRGGLDSRAPELAALRLEAVLLEPLASEELPLLRELSQRLLSATPIDSFRLAAGRLAIAAAREPGTGWSIERSAGDLAVSTASFRPDANWPAVSEAGGRLVWDERDLRFTFERGSIGGLRLVRGQLRRGVTPAWSLVAEGPAASALRALLESPLAMRMPIELRGAAVAGDARFELQVAGAAEPGPAATRLVEPLQWTLLARFDALRWWPLADAAPVEELRGVLRIVDGRLQPTRLEGRWLDQPLQISVDERRAGRRWQLLGGLPGGPLRELLADAYGLDPAAAPRWRLEVQPGPPGDARWRADFVLAGLPLRGQFEFAAPPAGGFELRRGALRLGAGSPRLPQSETLAFSAELHALELSRLAQAWSALSATRSTLPPLGGSLQVARLELLGEPLGPVALELEGPQAAPRLELRGERLTGVLSAGGRDGTGAQPPRLELERLVMSRLPGRAAMTISAAEPPWALDLQIAELSVGARRLGAWRGRLESSRQRFALESLSLQAGAVSVRGRLECQRAALRCALEARLAGGAPRPALELWGLATGFDAAQLEGTVRLAWPVAAPDDAWAALDGELRLTARDGVLEAPARLGLLPDASRSSWSWDELDIYARVGGGRVELERIAFEAMQRLLLSGSVELPSARATLDGEWWPRRQLPRALQESAAAPALAAIWRALRATPVVPRAVRVTGRVDALGMELLPLQSPAPP